MHSFCHAESVAAQRSTSTPFGLPDRPQRLSLTRYLPRQLRATIPRVHRFILIRRGIRQKSFRTDLAVVLNKATPHGNPDAHRRRSTNPGMRIILAANTMTEIQLAEAIAHGLADFLPRRQTGMLRIVAGKERNPQPELPVSSP